MASAKGTGALSGLRVIDLSTLFSGPQVSATLGDLGADVVKVEATSGDPMRRMGATREGHSLNWAMVSRNKRSVVLDLDTETDRARFHRLVVSADVLVENFPRAILERWEATWEELSTLNDRLVYVSVSGFGQTGPYAGRAAAGTLAEAFAGLTHMTGESEGPPMLTSVAIGDILAGISGVVGTLAALYHRDAREGQGQHIDVSMYEPVLQLLQGSVVGYDGESEPPGRMGSRVAGGVPRNTYRARDDHWLVVSATTDPQVARVLATLGLDNEAHRARFGKSTDRLRAADELDGLVASWIARHDRAEVLEIFEAARVPASPVNDLRDLLADPHVRARESIVSVNDPELGPVNMVAPVPKLSATPGRIRSAGPALGAHTEEVFREWLEEEVREEES